MKRVIAVFVIMVAGLSVGLWIKVRATNAAGEGPIGSSGVIEGTEVDVSARIAARVIAVTVKEGEKVKRGQVLVRLDCREPAAGLAAARAQLEVASRRATAARAQVGAALGLSRAAAASVGAARAQSKALRVTRDVSATQKKRIARLQGEGGATQAELDRATGQIDRLNEQLRALGEQRRAAYGQAAAAKARAKAAQGQAEAAVAAIAAAKAGVSRAQTLVQECTLRAPIDGVVQTRAREPGELALPGTRLLTLVRLDQVETVFYVPNQQLGAVAPGQAVTIKADTYPERTFQGVIARVSAKAEFTPRTIQTRSDRQRLVFAVTAQLANADGALRPGMPVEVHLASGAAKAGKAK
ncbi:MAG: efflux RND transporter periplasmic adaptor subunit [Myxococcales bacterium]|nr:efflux RND transporter periplasmic adaptor subunit [Myxococcales bacterium]